MESNSLGEQVRELVTLVTLAVVIVYFVSWLYTRHRHFQIFKRFGIPGPQPNFFKGNMHQLKSADTHNEILTEWRRLYGDVFGYYIGYRPYLVIYDLDILKQIFIKDFQNFVNRPEMAIKARPLVYSLLGLQGDRWKAVRRIITPGFSGYKIKQMASIINGKIDVFLGLIGEHVKNDSEFNIHKKTEALTLDVIGGCGLAMKVRCQTDPADLFLVAVTEFFEHCQNPAVTGATMFPFLASILEIINNYLTAGKMTTMVAKNIEQVIATRRANPELRGIDCLQLMLDASREEEEEGIKRTQLSDDEMIGNGLLFLLAGYETTATALAFAFYLLVMNPEVQEKLYEEVLTNVGDKERLSYDDIQELQYLDHFLNECLRIYPPVTGFVSRESQKDIIVNGQVIPKGVTVQAPTWELHHDPKLWSDPWKFNPDRFSPSNKGGINPLAFMPFGLGPRNCIGMRLAQLETKLTLARAVRRFKFIPCSKTEKILRLASPTGVLIRPANGITIKALLR